MWQKLSEHKHSSHSVSINFGLTYAIIGLSASLIMVNENIQLATFMYILFIFNNFNNMYEKCKIKYFVSLMHKTRGKRSVPSLSDLIRSFPFRQFSDLFRSGAFKSVATLPVPIRSVPLVPIRFHPFRSDLIQCDLLLPWWMIYYTLYRD